MSPHFMEKKGYVLSPFINVNQVCILIDNFSVLITMER